MVAEPDFIEDDLCFLVCEELAHITNRVLLPRFLSRRKERRWGWDAGYFLPHFSAPDPSQLGCNFFIQFKLSNEYGGGKLTHPAIGWEDWKEPFLRFDLFEWYKRSRSLHQRDSLVRLANGGFQLVYLTNHVLEYVQLVDLAQHNLLQSTLPVLRVDANLLQHERVSFTKSSNHFRLHSDAEKTLRETLEQVISEATTSSLERAVFYILSVLSQYEEAIGIKSKLLQKTLEYYSWLGEWPARLLAADYLLPTYLNTFWFWYEPPEKKKDIRGYESY